jgi:hypothetical protein
VAHLTKAADAGIDHDRSLHIEFAEDDAIVMASGELADTGGQDDEASA